MKNLLIIAAPGDEAVFFGGLLQKVPGNWNIVSVFYNPVIEESKEEFLRNFQQSAKMLGASETGILNFTEMQAPLYSIDAISKRLKEQQEYDKVFTYNIIDENIERQITAVATAKAFDEVYVRSMGGISDITLLLSKDEFAKKLQAVNSNYAKRIARRKNIISFDIKDIEAYQKFVSTDLLRFYYENLHLPLYDCSEDVQRPKLTLFPEGYTGSLLDGENPWDLHTSPYENVRYKVELAALHEVEWNKLIEIGACNGHFTNMLAAEFPDREIIATEPNHTFYRRLQKNVGTNIRTVNLGIQDWSEPCDVLFISCLLYYAAPFPQNLLESKAKYVMMSHHKIYHEQVVDPIMTANGFRLVYETDLAGRIEPMWNVLDTKEGTNIKVWTKK